MNSRWVKMGRPIRFFISRLMRVGTTTGSRSRPSGARTAMRGNSRDQTGDLLWCLVRVRDGDDVGGRPALAGNQEQSFAMHLSDGRPADGEHVVGVGPADARPLPDGGQQLRTRKGTRESRTPRIWASRFRFGSRDRL